MDGPQKLEFGQWCSGRSWPVWHYQELPEGVRPARQGELWNGRPVLWQVQLGPDKGDWYAARVTPFNIKALSDYIARGIPVYVKK